MREVNTILAKRRKRGEAFDAPQVALICLDPHTGEIKALVGGRNYGMSQLNHAVAKRPSGSVFKPFVYAAALNTGLSTNPNPITASTMLADEPRAFDWAGATYEPTDFHKDVWSGQVLLPTAFAKSLNVPAVEVAEQTGLCYSGRSRSQGWSARHPSDSRHGVRGLQRNSARDSGRVHDLRKRWCARPAAIHFADRG